MDWFLANVAKSTQEPEICQLGTIENVKPKP